MGTNYMLSFNLLNHDFLLLYGHLENGKPIGMGSPWTWDLNNGVIAIYDEFGRPWAIRAQDLDKNVKERLMDRNVFSDLCLRRGAFVPFSNDGGRSAYLVLKRYCDSLFEARGNM